MEIGCGVGELNGSGVGVTCRRGPAALFRQVAVPTALLLLATPLPASTAGRVALVVGNSAYAHIGHLPNTVNDATDVGAALQRLGFDVTVTRDAGRTELNEALRAFTRRSTGTDVALVFYAGHGMEMDGVNYLLPVDARIERDTDVRYETVTLDDVLAATAGAGLRVVILDACRNNPLARSMTRTVRTRSVSNGSFGDLDDALLEDETLVAYSAAAGTTADDGQGRNSPYAAALLAHLEDRLEVGMLFRRVRERVLDATAGRQRPHEYHSLLGEHYLGGELASAGEAGGPASPRPTSMAASGSSPVLAQQETVFWESVRESANPAEIEAYLTRWPNGVYAPLARTRVAALRLAAVVDRPAEAVEESPAPAGVHDRPPVVIDTLPPSALRRSNLPTVSVTVSASSTVELASGVNARLAGEVRAILRGRGIEVVESIVGGIVPELHIEGTVELSDAGNVAGTDFMSSTAAVSLQAIEAATGAVVAASRARSRGAGISAGDARDRAGIRAVEGALAALIDDLITLWLNR